MEYLREGGSRKHISDIISILDNPDTKLDMGTLNNFLKQLSLEELWEDILKAKGSNLS